MHVSSIEAIFRALDAAHVRYLVAGGVAVNGYGLLRFTKDLDLVVQLERENLLAALRALESLGFKPAIPATADEAADPAIREQWVREKNMLVLQLWSDCHARTPIDIFITEPFDFDVAYAQAPVVELAAGCTSRLVPIDRLIAMKEEAGRPQDLMDVESLRMLRDIDEPRSS